MDKRIQHTPPEAIAEVLRWWRLDLARVRHDIPPVGSPERTEFRVAVEATDGAVYVLERVAEHKREHRRKISAALRELVRRGVGPLHPYLLHRRESSLAPFDGSHWQLMPYVEGVDLPRPGYVLDAWRGRALGDFLVALAQKGQGMPTATGPAFSIKRYVEDIVQRLRDRRPELAGDLRPACAFLEGGLFHVHDDLPCAFVHGDYHPLNVIWGEDGLRSVLDWEFMGIKPELYDAANLIGCVGMDEPDGLLGPLVLELVGTLRRADVGEETSWDWLPDYVLALRFAWMREWLHRDEEEMVELELAYMDILLRNRDAIRETFLTC